MHMVFCFYWPAPFLSIFMLINRSLVFPLWISIHHPLILCATFTRHVETTLLSPNSENCWPCLIKIGAWAMEYEGTFVLYICTDVSTCWHSHQSCIFYKQICMLHSDWILPFPCVDIWSIEAGSHVIKVGYGCLLLEITASISLFYDYFRLGWLGCHHDSWEDKHQRRGTGKERLIVEIGSTMVMVVVAACDSHGWGGE